MPTVRWPSTTNRAPTCLSAIILMASYTDAPGEMDQTSCPFVCKSCATVVISHHLLAYLLKILPGHQTLVVGSHMITCPRTLRRCTQSLWLLSRQNVRQLDRVD